MLERAIERYRSINEKTEPEESARFRLGVLTTVLISACSAAWYSDIGIVFTILIMAGVITGFYFSYRTRYKSNLGVKFILSILLLVVFVLFWVELGSSIHDLRYPMIQLFLGLQVLHSFDVPARRDLDFSLVSAAILMAFSGSLSSSSDFLYFLVPFFISAMLTMYIGRRASFLKDSDVTVEGIGRRPASALLLSVVALVPLATVVFMVMPRLPGFSGNYLPATERSRSADSFQGLIRNPGYENIPENFPSKPLPFDEDSYFGFNRFLDLRVRGVPSDKNVMKIRSDRPTYWRATAFDKFLGNGWENTTKEDQKEEIASDYLPIGIMYPKEPPLYYTQDVIQTFLIEEPLPNTLFSSYIPRDLYFPTRIVKVDPMMTVYLPVTLDPGLIYTVVSEVSVATPDALQKSYGKYPPGLLDTYCQLPEMLYEVGALAEKITDGLTNNYDKVMAISDYLKEHYRYDLDTPAQGDDENTVEFFLFKQKRGYCEHFSTALAVMCRSLGIPARVAVGYYTGTMNSLTGYYEVSARDAHAWVEVYFPFFGWVSFDPTPGRSEPFQAAGRSNTWSGLTIIQKIGSGIAGLFPPSWKNEIRDAAVVIGRSFKSFFSSIGESWRGITIVFGMLCLLFIAWYAYQFRKQRSLAASTVLEPAGRAALLFEQLCRAGLMAGVSRKSSQTPTEYGESLDLFTGTGLAGRAASLFNAVWFSEGKTTPGDLYELESAVEEATTRLKEHRKRFWNNQ